MTFPRTLDSFLASTTESQPFSRFSTFDALTTTLSSGVKRLYLKNNALSIFMNEGFLGDKSMDGVRAHECVNDFRFGYRHDANHSQWHRSKKDFELMHTHIIKNNAEIVSPDELKCMLDNIMRFDKGFKSQMKSYNQTISYTYDECVLVDSSKQMLTKEDHEYLLQKYSDFYYGKKQTPEQQETIATEIDAKLNEVNNTVSLRIEESAKAVALSFFNTLLHNYLKPYLINKPNSDYKKITWACEILNTAFNLALSHSPLQAGYAFILRNTIKLASLKIGIDTSTAESLANQLSTLVAITQDPLQLVQLGMNASFANLGQSIAYGLIRNLPKLRSEPAIEAEVPTVKDKIPQEVHQGLRQRKS